MNRKLNPQLYKPCVSAEQLLSFKADKPETFTPSPFVNAFLKIFYESEAGLTKIAEALGVSSAELNAVLRVETGRKFQDFIDLWKAHKLKTLMATHPEYSADKLARAVGFCNHSALWKFYNSERYKAVAAEINGVKFPEPERQEHFGHSGRWR